MPSTVISAMKYDVETAILQITFVTGLVYHYKNVPETVYNELRSSKTKGIYFNRHIKDNFEFERVA